MGMFGGAVSFFDKYPEGIYGANPGLVGVSGFDKGPQTGSQIVRKTAQILTVGREKNDIMLTDRNGNRVTGVEAGENLGIAGTDGRNGFGNSGFF